jgi:hypothetical protein
LPAAADAHKAARKPIVVVLFHEGDGGCHRPHPGCYLHLCGPHATCHGRVHADAAVCGHFSHCGRRPSLKLPQLLWVDPWNTLATVGGFQHSRWPCYAPSGDTLVDSTRSAMLHCVEVKWCFCLSLIGVQLQVMWSTFVPFISNNMLSCLISGSLAMAAVAMVWNILFALSSVSFLKFPACSLCHHLNVLKGK